MINLAFGDIGSRFIVNLVRVTRGKPLPADLPRIEVIYELSEHELTCARVCHKHAIGEEISEQLEIVPMQIRVFKRFRKIYGCRDCESAPVRADKHAQLIKKYGQSERAGHVADDQIRRCLPLHLFEKVLGRYGIDIPCQSSAHLTGR